MSASDKKKLRKEQTAAIMSEKQRQAQAEAKKLKIYTITFVSVLALVICIAVGVLGIRAVNHSGVFQKNTIAAVIGDKELNSVELSYYYADAINEYYNQWYSSYSTYTDTYLQMTGLDPNASLNSQTQDKESGKTWAQYFIDAAIEQAKNDYALYNAAKADADFKLPEDDQKSLDNLSKNIETYAMLYGYSNANQYLRAMYGYGSDVDSYLAYSERSAYATAYYNEHHDSLTYKDEDIRAYEKDKYANYSSFTYSYAYLSYNDFIKGGTKSEDGKTTTYTDEEKQTARDLLKQTAESLATATDKEDLKNKLKDAPINESSQLAVNDFTNVLYSNINGTLAEWLSSKDRVAGEIGAVANTTTTKDADGKEKTETNGYYVVIYTSTTENTDPMANVRHLLVKYKGGTEDKETGETVYSDKEKEVAKTQAEKLYKEWQDGDATEESFIELVKKNSDDSSKSEGGLFEDIHPDSSYVPEFLKWSTDKDRKKGDTGIISTEYGYHIMYYVGDDDMTYRDYLITSEMRDADQEKWYESVLEPVTTAIKDTSKMDLDRTIKG